MRTKSMEKKRYSLRAPRKMLRLENEFEETELSLACGEESPLKTTVTSPNPPKKTKRKGKPIKSASKEEMQELQLNTPLKMDVGQDVSIPKVSAHSTPVVKTAGNKSSLLEKKSPQNKWKKCNDFVNVKQPPKQQCRVIAKPPDTNQSIIKPKVNDFPVYVALEHAIRCRVEKGCNFQKCSIAKQFLQHSSSCDEKKENCTICKAMDIMLCKHAEKCEISIDRSCPIPNCDHVRKLMMEEWLKFRNNHHEIVTRAFSGLIHARKCKDKCCDSILCKNIKAVLLHTQTCTKKEDCKTRRFVVQLCEYHQNTCHDVNCSVEFCIEGRKLLIEENARKRVEMQILCEKQELPFSLANAKPITNFAASNNMFFPTGLQGFFNLQQQMMTAQNANPMIYSGVPTGWQVASSPTSSANTQPTTSSVFKQDQIETFGQMSIPPQEERSITEPSPDVNLSSQHWEEKKDHSIHEESQDLTLQNWNEIQQSEEVVQCDSTLEVINTDVQKVCSEFPRSNALPLEHTKVDDQSSICTSPDMLYQFLSMKPDHPSAEVKEQLPSLSPHELQNILARDGNTNILSPVHDNRAQFSEAPFLLNEFQQNTQESEMEENPMEVENDENIEYRRCLANTEIQADKMSDIMKNEEEWSKIDFVKEHKIQQGYEVETETADETTENESVYDQQSPSAMGVPEACYYVNNNNNFEESPSVENNGVTNMTSLERNFLAILQAQQRK